MSLLWTLTATFLYTEIFVVFLFLLPINPSRWRSIFKSRAVSFIVSYANLYFAVFLLMLIIMLIDSIREMKRFSAPLSGDELKNNPLAENAQHMKLFRAQRNFYIAGFSVFLFVVLRRLVVFINNYAVLQADCDASKKQAESATAAAERLMKSHDKGSVKAGLIMEEAINKLEKAEKEILKLTEELNQSKLNQEAMKSQAESTMREYDRLLKEHEMLQKKEEGSKKDE